jgi:hypothetical protein
VTEQHETRRELSAVPIAVGIFAIVLAVLGGIWIGPWTAAIVTVGLALTVITALVVWFTRRAHPPAIDTPRAKPRVDARYRILVVADDCRVAPRSIEGLLSNGGGHPVSVFVMAPALESRVGRLTGDQRGYDDAARHLNGVLEALRGAGLEAQGEVGPDDPLQAADDGLRQFPADEIVFVTHPDGHANWLEDGVVAMAGSRYDQPVKHIVASP